MSKNKDKDSKVDLICGGNASSLISAMNARYAGTDKAVIGAVGGVNCTGQPAVSVLGNEEDDVPTFADGEMSTSEKKLLMLAVHESGELDYPMRELAMASGPVEQEYVIPDEERVRLLNKLWPFADKLPDEGSRVFDLHKQAEFDLYGEFRIIRYRNRNLLVSPDYPATGGTCLDWLSAGDRHEQLGITLKKL